MKNLKTYEELNWPWKKSTPMKSNVMTERDDISSNFEYLLKKAYDNKCLYILDFYGIESGARVSIPYSDGEERIISINFSLGGKRGKTQTVSVSDGPRNMFRGETDAVKGYQDIMNNYVNPLIGTEYDKTR